MDEVQKIELSDESIREFLEYLKDKEVYLDTGMGAFHTDDHSNW